MSYVEDVFDIKRVKFLWCKNTIDNSYYFNFFLKSFIKDLKEKK